MDLLRIFSCFKMPSVPAHSPEKGVNRVVKKVAKGSLLIQKGLYSTEKDISILKEKALTESI